MKKDQNKLTITQLSEMIGVSKPTVYARAKALDIKLSGVYSANEINELGKSRKKVKSKVDNRKVNSNQSLHFTSEKDNIELADELRGEINYLKNQIDAKDKQIAEANKLADQSQKLQADLQRKLDSQNQELLTLKVKDKQGFWARLFGAK